jgi:hypothetical protein
VRKCPNKKIPIAFLNLICYNINTVREGKTKGGKSQRQAVRPVSGKKNFSKKIEKTY